MSERYDCDGCGKLIGSLGQALSITFHRPIVNLPHGGFTMGPIEGHRAHFHGWDCLAVWANNSGISPLVEEPGLVGPS